MKHGSKSTVSDGAPDFVLADLFTTAICSSRYVCTMPLVSTSISKFVARRLQTLALKIYVYCVCVCVCVCVLRV